MAGENIAYRPADLTRYSVELLTAADTPPELAELVTTHLIGANLAGHDSHGILRIPSYVEMIDRGQLHPAARPTVLRETPTIALIDGNHGFGYTTMDAATRVGATKARKAGLAVVSIRNCGHIGRVGGWVEALASDGLVAQLSVGSLGRGSGGVAPFGGAARVLGTNPWAIGIPSASGSPVVLDFATSAVAEGKLRVARAKKTPLPVGWIVDAEGRPSSDVEDFYRGGMLLPFGGHKGYAMSVIASLYGGLSGAGQDGRIGGVFLLVVDPAAFGESPAYREAVDGAIATLRSTPAAPGMGRVQVPGEPEQAYRWLRERAIPIPAETMRQLREVATRFGVAQPEPFAEHRRLGEYLVDEFGVAPTMVRTAVEQPETLGAAERQPLGTLLVGAGQLDAARLEAALRRQAQDDTARAGRPG